MSSSDFTQVINFDGDFVGEIDSFLEKHHYDKLGFNYNLVTVLGCQSSGKSSLLNALFGTPFEVMHAETGRKQTTKGLWLAVNKKEANDKNILVMDVEGTDSRERGENRHTFEHRASLFALAVADILVINVWQNDIGRHGASNMALLKTVMKVNLDLFHAHNQAASKTPSRTMILFVVRDFDGQTPLRFLEATLMEDVRNIWSEIRKPDGLQTITMESLFEFKAVSLAKATDERTRPEFDEGVVKIREEMSLHWLPGRYSRSVPADGFGRFMQTVWQQISASADLDIPSQRRLLAQFRCEELKLQVLHRTEPRLQQLRVYVAAGKFVCPDNVDVCVQVCRVAAEAVTDFDELASRYDPVEVYLEKRRSLVVQLKAEGLKVVQAYFNALRTSEVAAAKSQLEALVVKGKGNNSLETRIAFWSNMMEELFQWATQVDDNFEARVSEVALRLPPPPASALPAGASHEDSVEPWDLEATQQTLRDAIEQVAGMVSAEERQLARKALAVEFLADPSCLGASRLDELLLDPGASKESVWRALGDMVKAARDEAISTFTPVFGGLNEETTPIEDIVGLALLATVRAWADDVARQSLEQRVVERFRAAFQRDGQGVPRHWPALTPQTIAECFASAQKQALALLDILEQIALPPSAFVPKDATPSEELQSDLRKKVVDSGKRQAIQTRAGAAMEHLCREALMLQATQGQANKVPLWLWGVLVVLGWNEFMAVLTSPFMLILVLVAVVVAGLTFATGNKTLPLILGKQGLNVALNVLTPVLSQLQALMQPQPDLKQAVAKEKSKQE